jgi:hypothetical protein
MGPPRAMSDPAPRAELTWSQADGLRVHINGHVGRVRSTRFNARWEGPSEYDGIRARWSEATLYRERGTLLLVVTAVIDCDAGVRRDDWEIWMSSDDGASWADSETFFRATTEPLAKLVS